MRGYPASDFRHRTFGQFVAASLLAGWWHGGRIEAALRQPDHPEKFESPEKGR